jgi:hypothetical protein
MNFVGPLIAVTPIQSLHLYLSCPRTRSPPAAHLGRTRRCSEKTHMIGTFRASERNPKLSHSEAMRQSMLSMIDAAKSDAEADPRLWAPFVVVGEPAKAQ